jgi:hypothetical protein
MLRPLALVAFFGLSTSVVSFSIAASLDRAPFVMDWPSWRRLTITDACAGTGEPKSRGLAWSGDGGRLVIEVPGAVTVTPGAERSVSVEGPAAAVDHLVMEDGRLYFEGCSWDGSGLRIRIAGPAVASYAVRGVARLTIDGIAQPEIDLAVTGTGWMTASGHVGTARIAVTGSGRADFGKLEVDRLTASITGSGRTTLAPKLDADLKVTGSGRVALKTRPEHLRSRVTGSGRIVEGSEATEAP